MSKDPTGRALQLLSLLQTHRLWRATELATRLGVTERTVRRDADRLRDLGYPVAATPGRYGGYRLESGAHLPPLMLDDDEAVAIVVGLRQAAGAAIDSMEETSLRALATVEQLLPDRLRRRVSALHSSITPLRRPDDSTVDPSTLGVLAAACRDLEQVRFRYRGRSGETGGRHVEPHRLVSAGQRWYLVGWDVHRRDWRTFRLDRIDETRPVGRRFTLREIPGGDAAAFVAAAVDGSRTHDVVLTVRASHAALQAELRWMDHTLLETAGERCRVRLRAEDPPRLALTVARLALTAPVVVEEPGDVADLVERLLAHLSLP